MQKIEEKIEETKNYKRTRLESPKSCKKGSFRTKEVNDKGDKVVLCKDKKSGKLKAQSKLKKKDENYIGEKGMAKRINEGMSVKQAKELYRKHGMLFLDDEDGKEAYDVLYNAGYTMKKRGDGEVAYCIELERMRESFDRKSVNENELNQEEFTDRVDADFDTSLYEYGVVRNPKNDMTLIGRNPGDDGLYTDYAVMYISIEDVKEVLEEMEEGFYSFIGEPKEEVLARLSNDLLAINIMDINMYNGWWSDQAQYQESLKTSKEEKEPVNEGNYEGGNAYYQFCKDIKVVMEEGHDFEEAVYSCLDDLVYYSDVINVWSNMPGNLGSREQEITDLMREDIEEAVMSEQEYIEGLDESLKTSKRVRKSVNETIYDKYGNALTDEEWNKREAQGMNEMGYRSQNSGIPLSKKVGTFDKDGVVNYRGTDVFTLKDGVVKLNNGGWFTHTTKDRMNQALDQYDVGGEVKQIKGTWYYIKNGEKKEFEKNGSLTFKVNESMRKPNIMKRIINESQAVLSMNESECGEMLTWQFTLNKATNKTSFGGNNISCVMTESNNGVVVTNFTMTEEQVRKAIDEALIDNGIKSKVSKLINLY